jgi:glutamate/tyrosine decarboxylase-like PLP-dependent enzyme
LNNRPRVHGQSNYGKWSLDHSPLHRILVPIMSTFSDIRPRTAPADLALLSDAAWRAATYLQGAPDRRVSPSASAIENLRELERPLPVKPSPASEVLDTLDRVGSAATMITAAGRFFGFVNGGAVPASVAASWLVSAWDQNAALRAMSPAAAAFETVALQWVRDLLHVPAGSGGVVVTGATVANLCGLAAARHALLARAGWDAENDGVFGAPPVTVVVGDEVHLSVIKALGLLGLGRRRVHRVAVDRQGRMRPDALPRLDDRTIVCIQAGNVNTGAFDPAVEICQRAHAAGAWVHVDGAFGLWATCAPAYRHLTEGFDRADSWATDGHKWPNVGYDCGIALVRDPRALGAAMALSSAYFNPGDSAEPSQCGPELSRRARGVELWATLRALGREGLANLIERTCVHAQTFAEGLRDRGHEILNEVVINQVLVSFGSPARTRAIIAAVQQEGTCWCGATEWQGRTAMRISVSSWATSADDVQRSLAAICRIADECGDE